MHRRKVNLFIYGSLRDSRIFQSVSGFSFTRRPSRIDQRTLFAEPAFLPHYRRVSPDNVYFYAVATPASRIEGLVIHDVPLSAMACRAFSTRFVSTFRRALREPCTGSSGSVRTSTVNVPSREG